MTAPIRQPARGDAGLLADAELLAVVLGPGAGPGLARDVLARFGGLRQALNAPPAELAAIRGIGGSRVAVIVAARELARRYFEATLSVGQPIRSPADTETFLKARLRDRPHEVFCCLYLDNRHRVLAFEELFRGTIDGTSVYPREIVKQALAANAAAVILAHNRQYHFKQLIYNLFSQSFDYWYPPDYPQFSVLPLVVRYI